MTLFYKISVIIPIYGVEKYIAKCVETLMRQTLKEVEYIFVNDCTKDNSISILQEVIARFPERKEHVMILHHDENRGLPAARNTGMQVARGQFIYHCDSDDYVELTLFEDLYNAAIKNNADYVWCDWFLSYNKTERYMKMSAFESADDALKCMLAGGMKYNVWNKIVNRDTYIKNHIVFPEGHAMGEDMTMIKLIACAKHVTYVPKALYHYIRINSEAMTQSLSDSKIIDIQFNISSTISFISQIKHENLENWFDFFKLQAKYPFLITDNDSILNYWKSLYPEANRSIGKNIYDSKRTKAIQWLAKHNQYRIIKLYYKIVYKTIYPIIYQ